MLVVYIVDYIHVFFKHFLKLKNANFEKNIKKRAAGLPGSKPIYSVCRFHRFANWS
jgi:hypothetical protein